MLPVEVASVVTVPEDSRVYIKNNWGKFPRLKPNTLNEVGKGAGLGRREVQWGRG